MHFFTFPVLLLSTHWTGYIWPHFDVRTISVAWKLKELQIFFDINIFSITLFSVKLSPTVECSSRRLLHNVLCSPFQTWLTCLVTRWRGGASVDTSTCFHSPFLLLRTPHCSNITARRIQVLPHKGMPLTAASTFTTQHNYPPKMETLHTAPNSAPKDFGVPLQTFVGHLLVWLCLCVSVTLNAKVGSIVWCNRDHVTCPPRRVGAGPLGYLLSRPPTRDDDIIYCTNINKLFDPIIIIKLNR